MTQITIDFQLTQHDDGYNIGDWFAGGWLTIETAQEADTPAEAETILREAYRGPDSDGVEVRWMVQCTRAPAVTHS